MEGDSVQMGAYIGAGLACTGLNHVYIPVFPAEYRVKRGRAVALGKRRINGEVAFVFR